MNFSLKD